MKNEHITDYCRKCGKVLDSSHDDACDGKVDANRHAFASSTRYPLACAHCGKGEENWRHEAAPVPEAEVSDALAESMPDLMGQLGEFYQAWCRAQGLDLGSTEELMATRVLTPGQRQWLTVFEVLWDATQDDQDRLMMAMRTPKEETE